MKDVYLDDEEKKLAESLDRGEWWSVENVKQEMQKLHEAARNTLRENPENGKLHNPTGRESG
jgi:cytochrome c-type biogenesis protein CcmH/NrfG